MQQKIDKAIEQAVNDSAVNPQLKKLRQVTSQLREQIGTFEELSKDYQSNVTAIVNRFNKIELNEVGADDAAILRAIEEDFTDKLQYLQSGHVSAVVGEHEGAVLFCQFVPESRQLITHARDNKLKSWVVGEDLTRELEMMWEFTGPERISAVAVAKSRPTAVIGFVDGNAQILDLKTGKAVSEFQVAQRKPISLIDVSANGDIGVFVIDRQAMTAWSLSEGEQLRAFDFAEDMAIRTIANVTVSPNGTSVAITYIGREKQAGSVAVFDLNSGEKRFAGENIIERASAKFLPDQKNLALFRKHDATLFLSALNADGGFNDIVKQPEQSILAFDVSDDGKTFVASGVRQNQGVLTVVRPGSDNPSVQVATQSPITSMHYDKQTNVVFTGSADGKIRTSDLALLDVPPDSNHNVAVTTWRGTDKEKGHFIWYVPKALIDTPGEFGRFDALSHSSDDLPPGRYYLWAGGKQPSNTDTPLRIRDKSFRQIDIRIK